MIEHSLETLLNEKELARLFRVSIGTLRYWRINGRGPRYRKVGQLVRYAPSDGAGDEVNMSIAGHVSRAMLSRYSHVRMEAKRKALDEIAARQRAADEKRKGEAERRERATNAPESAIVQ